MNTLDVPMNPKTNDAEASNIREYLKRLLSELWDDGESFSGKRPFGNSGWEFELYTALVAAKMIDGELDSDGYLITYNKKAAHNMIRNAIKELK